MVMVLVGSIVVSELVDIGGVWVWRRGGIPGNGSSGAYLDAIRKVKGDEFGLVLRGLFLRFLAIFDLFRSIWAVFEG